MCMNTETKRIVNKYRDGELSDNGAREKLEALDYTDRAINKMLGT